MIRVRAGLLFDRLWGVCDGCGATGPEIVGNADEHWDTATAALESGFTEVLEGRVLKLLCLACAPVPGGCRG